MNNNDNTVYTNGNQGFNRPQGPAAPNPNPVPNPNVPRPNPNMKSSSDDSTKKVAAVGAAVLGGGVLGAGGMYAGEAIADNLSQDDLNVDMSALEESQSDALQMTVVRDDLPFDEAFAAARDQLGAGGVFVWRGGVYGTYTSTEWNAMTPAQQAEFTRTAMEQYGEQAGSYEPEAAPREVIHEVHHVYHHDVRQAPPQPQREEPDVPQGLEDNGADEPSAVDDGVRILGQRTQDIDGQEVDIADIEYQGHSGILVDVDQDGVNDISAIDYNDNQNIEDNEITYLNGYQGGSTASTDGEGETDVTVFPEGTPPDADTPPDMEEPEVQVVETDTDSDPVVFDDDQPADDQPADDGNFTADNDQGGMDDDVVIEDDVVIDDDPDVYVAENTSDDGMSDFVNDANVDMMA